VEQQLPSITAYSFDPETGEYEGTATAWENPMDRGTFLLPSNSTDIAPPTIEAGERRRWDGQQWVVEPIPPPTPEQAEVLAERARQRRELLLMTTDFTQLPDVPISGALRTEFSAYRQALRDLPQQPGWPETVVWPVKPTYQKS
jgi:hypothetical protein